MIADALPAWAVPGCDDESAIDLRSTNEPEPAWIELEKPTGPPTAPRGTSSVVADGGFTVVADFDREALGDSHPGYFQIRGEEWADVSPAPSIVHPVLLALGARFAAGGGRLSGSCGSGRGWLAEKICRYEQAQQESAACHEAVGASEGNVRGSHGIKLTQVNRFHSHGVKQ